MNEVKTRNLLSLCLGWWGLTGDTERDNIAQIVVNILRKKYRNNTIQFHEVMDGELYTTRGKGGNLEQFKTSMWEPMERMHCFIDAHKTCIQLEYFKYICK